MRSVSGLIVALAIVSGLAATGAASAAEGVEVEMRNGSSHAIACRATLAHWFAVDLAEIEPGGSATFVRALDRETGTLSMLNATRDLMPVELLFCGYAGRVYETRALLPLRQSLDAIRASTAARFECTDETDMLVCR